jgi:tetratricopeptide (TPR) repeat protein
MIRVTVFVLLLGVVCLGAGCGGGKLSDDKAEGELPAGHPPLDGSGRAGGPMAGALGDDGPTDDHPLPLKLTGLNSLEELERALAATDVEEARGPFEAGYRMTFTADPAKRNYPGAVRELEQVLVLDPDYAEAYRALGYAKFNMGFDVNAAMENYTKAVELDPEYGEAHYALAFLYAMGDRGKGQGHFEKAMELGVPDERNLGPRFYGK